MKNKFVEKFYWKRKDVLAEQSEEELDASDRFVLYDDFDSMLDGECPPLIRRDHANGFDSDDSEDEWVIEEDFDPCSHNTNSSWQALQFGTKNYFPSKSVFVDEKI